MKTIYGLKDSNLGVYYGVHPYEIKYQKDYDNLSKVISLKDDLNWREVQDLQELIVKSDVWENIPIDDITIINAEFKIADMDQRVDILFLDKNGCVLPCELKITGESKDTHGQLIRYLSDLSTINLNMNFVNKKFDEFMKKISDEGVVEINRAKYENFIRTNNITNITTSPTKGLIIDVDFKPQLFKAVNHLNNLCNFDIKLIKITTKVDINWTSLNPDYFFKLEFEPLN